MRKTFVYRGTPIEIEITPLPSGGSRAVIDGRVVDFMTGVLPDGGVAVTVAGERHVTHAARVGDSVQVSQAGAVFTFTMPEGRGRRSAAAGDLTAPMPGQVRGVFVSAGESVTRGQLLFLLEAMKMEIRITAPADGIVIQVSAQVGAVVERGQRLAEMGETRG